MMRKIPLLAILFVATSLLAAGREIAPRPIQPSPFNASEPQTAFAGDRFLTVWIESMGEIGSPLMGMFSNARGDRISERAIPIPVPFPARAHELIGAGNSFALFSSTEQKTRMAIIDAQGNVTRSTVLDLPEPWRVRAAWNGTWFLVLAWSGEETRAYLVDRSGRIAMETPMPRLYTEAITPFEGGFVVTTAAEEGLYARRVTNDGTVTRLGPIEPETSSVSRGAIRSARTPRGTLLVWNVFSFASPWPNEHTAELRSAVIRDDGTIGPVRILATADSRTEILHLSRSKSGSYVLTFVRQQGGGQPSRIMTLTLHSDGSLRSPIREVATMSSPWAAASSDECTLVVFPVRRPLRSLAIGNDGLPSRAIESVAMTWTRQSQPALSSATSRLLAAWTEDSADEIVVRAASLRADGTTVSHHTVTTGELASTGVPWNGSEGIVLVKRRGRHDAHLYATFVDLDARPVAAEPILLGEISLATRARPAATVWAGDRWIVAWPHALGRGIEIAVIQGRSVSRRRLLELSTPVPEHRYRWFANLALARNAKSVLLAWTEELIPSCAILPPCGAYLYRTYAQPITSDGAFSDPNALEIPSGSHSLSVATSGDEFLISADATVTILDGAARRVRTSRTLFGFDAASDVTWDGSAYVVAMRSQLARWYLVSAHLDRDGNVVRELHGIETRAADRLIAPAIRGSIIALQEGDAANGARAVVYEEAGLESLPPPPSHPVARIEPDADGSFVVTWDPVPGAELYVVEGTDDPWWARVQVVRADRPLQAWVPTASVRVRAVGPGGASSPPPRRRSTRAGAIE